jgi:hypothetical protein
VPLSVVEERPVSERDRQEAAIESDTVVQLASQQRARLPIPLRHILLHRDDGRLLAILSNDLQRWAGDIAALYRKRWQIELLFRWIKQHLKIRAFLGRSENAIRLQLFAAMIAYLLLRIGATAARDCSPCALPTWCEPGCSNGDPSPLLTSRHRDPVLMLTTNSISPMLDFPRTALP